MLKSKTYRAAALSLCLSLSGLWTANAQNPGPGVDPNAVMMEDFESGTFGKWSARPGSRGEKMTLELMDASQGDIVRFGNYAMKVNIDFTNAQEQQTLTAQISPGTSGSLLQIPGNDVGGKRLGVWVYATPGVQGMWVRVSTRPIGSGSGVTNTDLASAINWTGWKYLECNLPKGHEFHPDGIRFLVLKSYENYFVNGYVIVDNIRVTNQSFSEDKEAPTISGLTGNDQPLTGTFNTTKIDLSAAFAEVGASGINYNSIRMLVDGAEFKAGDTGFSVDQTANTVSLTGLTLSNGAHTAEVIVEDNFGNIATNSASFTVEASDGKTTLVNIANSENAYVGTPYEIKINTNNAADIKELELVMEINNIGSVDAENGVSFAPSAAGSTFSYDERNGYLTINLKNDVEKAEGETLATVNVSISKNSNPTDILRCSPVSAKATYADNSLSLFSLFDAFEKHIQSSYDLEITKRIVGLPGAVLVTDKEGNPIAGANVYALSGDMATTYDSGVTGADGTVSDLDFTGAAQEVNLYAEKDGKYSYTMFTRTLKPLLTEVPEYIRAGVTPDPMTSKTITWMTNPVSSQGEAILKIAKKADGEEAFTEHTGKTKIIEYNALVSNGTVKGSAVTVSGLEPGTEYIYQVGDGTNWSETREFKTAYETDKFSFSAFGDLQASSIAEMSRFLAAAKTISEMPERPLFSLNVGDIIDSDDRYDCYMYYGYLLNQRPEFANIDCVASYGNHEYMGNPDADNIKFANGHHSAVAAPDFDPELLGTGTYAVEYGNMLVISLDWEHRGPASSTDIIQEYAKWMDKVLTEHADKTWKVVTLHYPIFPNASTSGTKETLGAVFDKHNVQMVFCGHEHTYERVQVKNGEYLVPTSDRRTFTPVIGGTIHMQLGDMRGTGSNGRWFHCAVNGKEMVVTIRDANNEIKTDESFTRYAAELNDYTVNFNAIGNGTIAASSNNEAVSDGQALKECSDIVFTATPDEGYAIKNWIVNGETVESKETTYTIDGLKENTTVTVEFESLSGVDNVLDATLRVFPNPAGEATVISGAANSVLTIMNITGSTVATMNIESDSERISLASLARGVYLFNIAKDNATKTVKVIKK